MLPLSAPKLEPFLWREPTSRRFSFFSLTPGSEGARASFLRNPVAATCKSLALLCLAVECAPSLRRCAAQPRDACTGLTRRSSDSGHECTGNLKRRCAGVRDWARDPSGGLQRPRLRAQALCSLEAGARLQGPLRRLQPLIRPPLAPKNNILVCLLGALKDRDRLFIPTISDAALLRPLASP